MSNKRDAQLCGECGYGIFYGKMCQLWKLRAEEMIVPEFRLKGMSPPLSSTPDLGGNTAEDTPNVPPPLPGGGI